MTLVNQPALPLRDLSKRHIHSGHESDSLHDPWSPFGDDDLFRLAETLARRNGFVRDEDLAHALDVALGRAGDLGVTTAWPDPVADARRVRAGRHGLSVDRAGPRD